MGRRISERRSAARAVALISAMAAAGCLLHHSTALAQTPEETKQWEAQRAQVQAAEKARAELLASQRAARRADPMAWVRTLDPMSAGGWVFRVVAPDGSWATFSTEHQMKRSGHMVTAWLRQEFAEPQHNPAGEAYASDVEKVQYDCTKSLARVMLIIYYTGNNLSGGQQSEEADPKQIDWDPIVPGTQSESIFHWTCGAASTGARP